MDLKEKLQTAWKNKGTIAEGFFNAYVIASPEVKAEALRRLSLCRENKCKLHDPRGESEKAVFKGKESCGGCGCDLYAKSHAMSAHCYLKDQQISKFKQLISEGYVQALVDGFIVHHSDKGTEFRNNEGVPFIEPELVAGIATANDAELWLIIQAIRAKGIEPPIGENPYWEEILTHEQEMEINNIAYRKQFENRK